jgi:hypothetical protein
MIFIATVETKDFRFLAVGNSTREATDALMAGWERHCMTTEDDPHQVSKKDVGIIQCEPGDCLRDGSHI